MTGMLTTTQHEAVRLITLDDAKANALGPETIAEFVDAITEAESDAATLALVVAGRPGIFSGGFDLEVMRSGDRSAVVSLVCDGGELVRRVFGSSLPVVAACTGHAVAAGALVLLGCDVRIGADGPFSIGLNEVSIGMVLPDWAHSIARERLTRPSYQRAVYNARLTDPATAAAAGFLDEVVDPADVIDRALSEAAALATLDTAAYRGSIERFRAPVLETMDRQIAADRASVS
jgi:enoyl-CoA hydratase